MDAPGRMNVRAPPPTAVQRYIKPRIDEIRMNPLHRPRIRRGRTIRTMAKHLENRIQNASITKKRNDITGPQINERCGVMTFRGEPTWNTEQTNRLKAFYSIWTASFGGENASFPRRAKRSLY